MSVYVIAALRFTDEAAYRRYQGAFPDVFAKFNARVLVADEAPQVLEGGAHIDKVVVLAFADASEAERFAEDCDYARIAQDRRAGAEGLVLLVRGL